MDDWNKDLAKAMRPQVEVWLKYTEKTLNLLQKCKQEINQALKDLDNMDIPAANESIAKAGKLYAEIGRISGANPDVDP